MPRLPVRSRCPRSLLTRNIGDDVAISLHVYGADISRLGGSVRRTYDLPVLSRTS